MKHILARTLETTLKKSTIILALVVGIIPCVVVNEVARYSGESYSSLLNELLIFQHLIVFFLINGLCLISICVSNSSGLIANEVHEGTFRLLVAKPNSRFEILLAKIIGTVLGCILLMILSLFAYFTYLHLFSNVDPNIINDLMAYLPSYLLYGLFVIVVFNSLSTLLSCIFKKKITALLPMIAITVIMLAVFPIFRLVSFLTGEGISRFVNLFDINYHFSLVFKTCIDLVGEIKGSRDTYMILSYLMNIFRVEQVDPDFLRNGPYETIVVTNTLIRPFILYSGYFVCSLIAYISSFIIIKRKDI